MLAEEIELTDPELTLLRQVVARQVACSRGFYRYLLPGQAPVSPLIQRLRALGLVVLEVSAPGRMGPVRVCVLSEKGRAVLDRLDEQEHSPRA